MRFPAYLFTSLFYKLCNDIKHSKMTKKAVVERTHHGPQRSHSIGSCIHHLHKYRDKTFSVTAKSKKPMPACTVLGLVL